MVKVIKAKNKFQLWFYSMTYGKVHAGEAVDIIRKFIQEEPNEDYNIILGTDSQAKRVKGKPVVDFVSVVIVHRIGGGGIYFLRKDRVEEYMQIRDKIYRETVVSLDLAQMIVPFLTKVLSAEAYSFEIHIDIGPNGLTSKMIKEVVGMVNGSGYNAKIKPESWGASTVADKHT